MTGTAKVSKATPDGYQFVFASVDSMAIVPTMHKKPLYNSVTDFTAVGLAVEQPIVLITRKDLPVSSMQEFVTYAKANHKQMQFGSSGVGSGSHFSCARLNAALGIDPTVEPEIHVYETQADDTFLLCSDGLSDMVEDEEIRLTLLTLKQNPTLTVQQLVQAANSASPATSGHCSARRTVTR